MSTERIYGGWDTRRSDCHQSDDLFQWLWHRLAAQNVGKPNFEPNSGLSQRKHEIVELWKLFRSQQPKTIVEIGTAQGGTFAAWCKLAPEDALLISIDRCIDDCRPRPGDQVHPEIAPIAHNVSSKGGGVFLLGCGKRVIAINGWSYSENVLSILIGNLNGAGVDFLFHDASHSRQMFSDDFKLYWPLVNNGGIFAVHDIMPSQAKDCDKSIEWNRIKMEEDYSAVFEYCSGKSADSMGIGVLIK